MPMVLVPLDGARPIPVDKAILFFGRGAECDVVLTTSRKVSRKHCCIAQIDDYYIVRDLGSMNGIRVNGQTVKGEMRLDAGDELWVGDLGFRFQPLTAGMPALTPGLSPDPSRRPPIDPRAMSQDLPVVIPDENVDFRVENSQGNPVAPPDRR